MRSLSGSGHRYATPRLRLGDKHETYKFDPFGLLTIFRHNIFYFKIYSNICSQTMVHLQRRKKDQNTQRLKLFDFL